MSTSAETEAPARSNTLIMVVAGVIVALFALVFALLLACVVIIAGLTLLGASINDKFETVGQQVQPAGQHLHVFTDTEPFRYPRND